MKAGDLITVIREDYTEDNDSAKYLWSNESLLRKLNEAQRQVCTRGNYLFDDSTPDYTQITLIEGVRSYLIDPKVTVIENVILNNLPLIKKTKEELDRDVSTWRTDTKIDGNTVYYMISGRNLILSRAPDADDAGTVVYMDVYRLPDEDIKTESQEFEIPEEYHRDLIWWVLYECYGKRDIDSFDNDKATEYLVMFNTIFGEPVSAKVRQHQFESPRSLVIRPITNTRVAEDTDW